MITHVAEAGEDRGRVVLHIAGAGRVADVALEAAVTIAKAFHSEIESIVVEDRQLVDLARFPFASEISFDGRRVRRLEAQALEHELGINARAIERSVLAAASLASVAARGRIVRDDPLAALEVACREKGPWNVVTLADPLRAGDGHRVFEMFQRVDASTGFVVTGPKARRTRGPVVALVEELERAPGLLKAAERLAAISGDAAKLWLVDEGAERITWLQGHVSLSLGLKAAALDVEAIDVAEMPVEAVITRLGEMGAGFVIARFGGRFAPEDAASLPLVERHAGPVLLVR